jgi:hypothetical protein
MFFCLYLLEINDFSTAKKEKTFLLLYLNLIAQINNDITYSIHGNSFSEWSQSSSIWSYYNFFFAFFCRTVTLAPFIHGTLSFTLLLLIIHSFFISFSSCPTIDEVARINWRRSESNSGPVSASNKSWLEFSPSSLP